MPEGHVIHRLADQLNQHFASTQATPDAQPRRTLLVTSPQGRFVTEAAQLNGHALDHAEAWGKHLFLCFDSDNPAHIVHIHLGLIGSMRLEDPANVWGQIRFRIEDPKQPTTSAVAANLRGPQWCRLITNAEMTTATAKLGADPLRDDANFLAIKTKVARSRRSIGSLLMDQKLFAGVGNIYRAETLFRLGISPFILGKDVAELDLIWQDLRFLMREGVNRGRIDTVRPEHTPETMGRPPRKDDHGGEVYVYRRYGQPCYVCGTPILERTMEGRNLFWCPTCQPD
ncbi:DNA-formamidopyrimidine glycosylase family protein [Corynebacterium diphtheriae]|uniref:DNA-formamidopyrimidine glycosylase family protein n=1 Tax=Corynebacterium diphtheriae TaxID=1717 RepID=UPI00403E04C1